jgi:hypothetical protein
MATIKKPTKVKYIHHWPADYRIYPANGIWGGITGRGDFVMHFFVERHIVPKEEIQDIKDDGTVAPIKQEPKEELEVARDMQMGIMINREQAANIAKWILEHVESYEKLISKKEGPKDEHSK